MSKTASASSSPPVSSSPSLNSSPCAWCKQPVNHNVDARVEIYQPPPRLTTNSSSHITLNPNGVGCFHRVCWQQLFTANGNVRRGQLTINNNNNNKPFVLTKPEQSMLRLCAKTAEHFDAASEVTEKVEKLYNLVINAKHAVVFGGAGLSTAAGIGDFRGKTGKWTLENVSSGETKKDDDSNDIPYEALRPTLSHEVLAMMIDHRILAHIITQNCDGLHRMSGVRDSGHLSELHGCIFVERCDQCGCEYERGFSVMEENDACLDSKNEDWPWHIEECPTCQNNHYTGRVCKSCGVGKLRDNIIHFGDLLNDDIIHRAEHHAKHADVMISLGSTMLVTPACELVSEHCKGQLVIINRQCTQLDDRASIRIHGDCDHVMRVLFMNHLRHHPAIAATVVGGSDGGSDDWWMEYMTKRRVEYDQQRQEMYYQDDDPNADKKASKKRKLNI